MSSQNFLDLVMRAAERKKEQKAMLEAAGPAQRPAAAVDGAAAGDGGDRADERDAVGGAEE